MELMSVTPDTSGGTSCFPNLFVARGEIQLIDDCGNFAESINKQRVAIAAPRDGSLSSTEARDRNESHRCPRE